MKKKFSHNQGKREKERRIKSEVGKWYFESVVFSTFKLGSNWRCRKVDVVVIVV